MRRPSQQPEGVASPRLPAAVLRGREVCGGARIGVDVGALLRPCVEQVLVAVFGPRDESDDVGRLDTDICLVLSQKVVAYLDAGFGAWLDGLWVCVQTLGEVLADHFRLPGAEVAAAVWQRVCPLWADTDACYLARCLAGIRVP